MLILGARTFSIFLFSFIAICILHVDSDIFQLLYSTSQINLSNTWFFLCLLFNETYPLRNAKSHSMFCCSGLTQMVKESRQISRASLSRASMSRSDMPGSRMGLQSGGTSRADDTLIEEEE